MALTLLFLAAVLLLMLLLAPRLFKAQSAPVPIRVVRKRTLRNRR
jgi:hypothetical protein